jgi:thiamine biosynthesis lipoprotein
MDTIVSIEVVATAPEATVQAAMRRATGWFGAVERACSRFDPTSELRRLSASVGEPVTASPVLLEAVQFALTLARVTSGAFDPTVGQMLEGKGFDRDYRTGQRTPSGLPVKNRVSYRDVVVDPVRRTVILRRPLLLDLGAIAKGLAVDLAARELAAFDSSCIDAGGDLYARGQNARGEPWRIGVQDPREDGAIAYRLEIADRAVCTSGDYERRTPTGDEHHLIDPRTGRSGQSLASVTVVAPTAMAADGLATAAFILGPKRGLRLLERESVSGILIAPSGEILTTRDLQPSSR